MSTSHDYRFGTHELAVKESQFKGQIRGPSPVKQGPSLIKAVLFAAPQLFDYTQQGRIFKPPSTIPGWIQTSISAGPDLIDLTPSSKVFKSVVATTVTPNPIARTFFTVPQTEDRPTRVIWQSVVAGQRPPIITSLFAAPQLADFTQQARLSTPPNAPVLVSYALKTIQGQPQYFDFTQQGWIEGTPPPLQAKVPPITQGAPQLYDFAQQAKLFAPFQQPPIVGPTVTQFTVPGQPDLNVNYSVTWTPATFSPSAPIPPIDPGIGGGPMGPLYPSGWEPMVAHIGYDKPKKEEEPEEIEEEIEVEVAAPPPKKRETLTLKRPSVDVSALKSMEADLAEIREAYKAIADRVSEEDDEILAFLLLL